MEEKRTMNLIPFWKFNGKNQFGIGVGLMVTKFNHMASYIIWEIQIELIIFRIVLYFNIKK